MFNALSQAIIRIGCPPRLVATRKHICLVTAFGWVSTYTAFGVIF